MVSSKPWRYRFATAMRGCSEAAHHRRQGPWEHGRAQPGGLAGCGQRLSLDASPTLAERAILLQ